MSKIHVVFGPQGAGKSTYSKKLSREINGVHFSIDAWMWNLYGEDSPNSKNYKWIMERVERCEKQIWATAKDIGACGCQVVLDLGFTKLSKRKMFRSLADEESFSTQFHYVTAPHSVRRKRVLERNIAQGETYSFEVTAGMFDFMEKEFHPPSDKELLGAVVVNTGPIGMKKTNL
jgi:predicted kinase